MNVNGLAAGTPLVIWDGEATYWTPSGEGSPTTGAAHSGTYGWDTAVTAKEDITKWDNGSLLDVAASYTTLRFWMQPKAFPNKSELLIEWQTGADSRIGVTLNVADYVTNFDLDVWQLVSIPIADFLLTASVQKLQIKYSKVAGQHFYFDDLDLMPSAGGGGPYTFRAAAPDASEKYHVTMVVVIFSAPSAGWASTAFANIAGGLANGFLIRQRRLSTSEVLWSVNSKDNADLFGRFHPQDDVTFSNDEFLVGFMLKPGGASVVITDDDAVECVIRDDLSTLISARAFVHYGVEAL
jgi:hypothetical protein